MVITLSLIRLSSVGRGLRGAKRIALEIELQVGQATRPPEMLGASLFLEAGDVQHAIVAASGAGRSPTRPVRGI